MIDTADPSAAASCKRQNCGAVQASVLNPPEGRDLLELLDDRHGRASTIVTSQIPVEHWHDIIGDPTLADAILDRLVHNAHRLQLTGESMRKKNARNQTLDANSNP